jgi:hypothetical protein
MAVGHECPSSLTGVSLAVSGKREVNSWLTETWLFALVSTKPDGR